MYVFEITRGNKVHYVPIIYGMDESTGQDYHLLPILPKDKLHAFSSIEKTQQIVKSMGYDSKVNSVEKIDLDKIYNWVNQQKTAHVNIEELELFRGLMISVSLEKNDDKIEKIDHYGINPLAEEIFLNPKLAKYEQLNMPKVSQEELQEKANTPRLKDYFRELLIHFDRIVISGDTNE